MKAGGWQPLILVYLYGMLSAASLGKVIPLHDRIAELPGAGPNSFALFIALFALAPALLGTLSGVVVDRIGSRPVLIAASLLGAAVNALYLLAPSIGAFLALRVLEGFIPLGIYAAAPALMIALSTPHNRNAAMSLWSTYAPVGTSVGLLLSAAFASSPHWRDGFALHGILFAGMAFMGLSLPRPAREPRPARAASRSAFALLYTRAGIRPARLAASLGLMIALGLGVSVVFPPYFAQAHHSSIGQASALLAAANIVMIAGSFASGVLLTRGTRCLWLFIASAAIGSLAAWGIFAPRVNAGINLLALLVWLVATGAAMAAIASLLPQVAPPEQRASVAGLLSQSGAIMTFITPSIWLPVLALQQWWLLVAVAVAGWILCTLVLPASGLASSRA